MRKSGALLGRFNRFVDEFNRISAVATGFHQDFQAHHDVSQQVVEVVRDPPRQLAHHLHFLRLIQLGLDFPALGNVAGVNEEK